MKIIDFHTHAGDFYRLREDIQELLTRRPMELGVDITLVLSDPKHLAKYIKPYGVEVGIVFAECGPGTNFSIDSELVANFCKNHKMLIPFGNINPNFHNDVIDEFWKSMKMGVKGFKFYPADHSFDPPYQGYEGSLPTLRKISSACCLPYRTHRSKRYRTEVY
ncbi:amidohydrolase family protein [Candidatus Marithrix sp. Canyon 246]|uniref:amidohydrolase family protein n=1 Tax=Candidatus Marithrix sp. Canyon 246 TaxID=1827136 RepID=UPI000849EE26|nr:amidohydrolase family protein [Candidatus Marithrix sp. Canyon 246]